jgi:translocation and assembly module TamA
VRAVLVVLVVLVACGGAQRPTRDRNSSEEYLAGIEIKGNQAIEKDELLDGLALHRVEETGRALDPYQLTIDTERIRAAYQQLGFFSVEVKSTVRHTGPGNLAEIAVFEIVEGPRAKTAVVIDGLPADVSPREARRIVKLKDDGPFDYDAFDDAKQPLLTLVEDAGYAHVDMTAEVLADKAHARATVRYVFDAGPICRFGAISIVGIDGPLADAIRARLSLAEGDRYSSAAMSDAQRAIYELGRFSSARVEADRTGDTVIPVKITVVEASHYESKLGGGFGYEPLTLEARARASITAAGIPGPLWNAGLDFRPAYTVDHKFGNPEPKVSILGTLSRLDLFAPFIRGDIELGYQYLTVEAYTSRGAHARLGLQMPLGYRWLTLRVGWLLEQLKFSKITPDALEMDDAALMRFGLDQSERLGEFQQAISADLRDDPNQPTRGTYLELRVAEGTKYAGSQFRFLQLTPEARAYIPVRLTGIPLLGKSVIAMRARLGMILGDVPVTERYYSGGASSQRGFSERHLAPYIDGVPIGGAGSIETGIELRGHYKKHLGLNMGVVAFLDGGDVTDTVAELNPFDLYWATGLGVRIEVIKSIVVRLDLGYRLNRYGHDSLLPAPDILDRLAFHLGVGQAY